MAPSQKGVNTLSPIDEVVPSNPKGKGKSISPPKSIDQLKEPPLEGVTKKRSMVLKPINQIDKR